MLGMALAVLNNSITPVLELVQHDFGVTPRFFAVWLIVGGVIVFINHLPPLVMFFFSAPMLIYTVEAVTYSYLVNSYIDSLAYLCIYALHVREYVRHA
jgi:hypothetical protein